MDVCATASCTIRTDYGNEDRNATENTHFNPTLEMRIKCDASRQGLGAQLNCEGWKTVAFASRFLNNNEERYSINELELFGVVWAIPRTEKSLSIKLARKLPNKKRAKRQLAG